MALGSQRLCTKVALRVRLSRCVADCRAARPIVVLRVRLSRCASGSQDMAYRRPSRDPYLPLMWITAYSNASVEKYQLFFIF